ncbi:hypothetical protein BC831DRAFT_453142 [Entophlyctis helioformis]|nr:hypothetical protein BC831DRAFT_453142 [Entophlyctis helioformis]
MSAPLALAAAAALALALAAAPPAAASWNRRAYYNDLACAGTFTYGIQVWAPTAPCQVLLPITASCEQKSRLATVLSSEGTACDNAAPVDTPWFPPAGVSTSAPYLTINSYAAAPGKDLCAFDKDTPLEMNTYLADGRCYAFEAGDYVSAVCTPDGGGIVKRCGDDKCSDCRSTTTYSTACTQTAALPVKAFCTQPGTAGLPPASTTNSTTGGAAGSAGSSAGTKSAPAASSPTAKTNAAAGSGGAAGVVAVVVGALAAVAVL